MPLIFFNYVRQAKTTGNAYFALSVTLRWGFFQVRITSLHVNKDTLEKIRTGDVTRSVQYEVGEQRPWFSYSKPMNYLKKEDRNELVQALLHINTMQKKYEIE